MKTGRPTRCTRDLIKKITPLISNGNFASTACRVAGISEAAFYNWQARGRKDREEGRATIFVEFAEAIERADAEGEARNVLLIQQAAGAGTWQAAAWNLERKYPEKWGRNRLEVTGPNDGPVQVEHSGTVELTAEQVVLGFLASRREALSALTEGDDG